jgi:hypothetical protein
MYYQVLLFGIAILIGCGFRLMFVASSLLSQALKLRSMYFVIDFVTIGICACIAAVYMIVYAQAVSFYLYAGMVAGVIAIDLVLDLVVKTNYKR